MWGHYLLSIMQLKMYRSFDEPYINDIFQIITIKQLQIVLQIVTMDIEASFEAQLSIRYSEEDLEGSELKLRIPRLATRVEFKLSREVLPIIRICKCKQNS